jgi:hypothetical protein
LESGRACAASKLPTTPTRCLTTINTSNSPNSRDSERVKVAGFCSQLDEEEESSDNERDKLSICHYKDEPDDERRWRHSQSPAAPADIVTIDTDESEETEKDTNPKGGQWNLIEQAACFAREKEDVTVEDQQSTNGSNQSLDRRYRTDSESRTERITSTIDYTRTTATVPIPKRKKKNRECFIV